MQDFSHERIIFALDASMNAFGALLSTLPHGALYDESGLYWFETGVPESKFNGVLQIRLEARFVPSAVERILAHFQQRNLPFSWYMGPSSQSSGLGELLEARGILHEEDEPGMVIDLHELNENLPLASNLTIHRVTTEEQMHQWTQTWGCGAPGEVIGHWFTVYSALAHAPECSMRLYIGTIDGKPVATVALLFAAGVAAIHHVVTLHEFRRQGIGAAMTLMAAREARSAGYRIAVLTSSPFGINIYRRLGFKEYCMTSTYEWSPTYN